MIDDTKRRLRNWQRWALNDDPHIGYPDHAAGFGEMIYENTDREGWGNKSPGRVEPPIDVLDARHVVDQAIMALRPIEHVLTIKQWYYTRIRNPAHYKQPTWEDFGAALRALDAILYPEKVQNRRKACALVRVLKHLTTECPDCV